MKKYLEVLFSLLFLLALLESEGYAQNYIYNPGFEYGEISNANDKQDKQIGGCWYTLSDFLYSWKRSTNIPSEGFHSPDWIRRNDVVGTNFLPGQFNSHLHEDGTPIYANQGYGMLGMFATELIQQQYNHAGLLSELNSSYWSSITLKMWIRIPSEMPTYSTLKVYLAKDFTQYVENTPHYGGGISCNNTSYCSTDLEKYVGFESKRKEILSISDIASIYSSGEWHLIEETFIAPSNINKLDWIMIDLYEPTNACKDGYLLIDDVQLTVGCKDECSRTDGSLHDTIVRSNIINNSNVFKLVNLSNIDSLRLQLWANSGALSFFDSTIFCINGIDRDLYWDGKNSLGSHMADGTYHYKITAKNDCGELIKTGTILKEADYLGAKQTNFHLGCNNGINKTPEECCQAKPDYFIDKDTLIGPDTNWSRFIVWDAIWVSTLEPDFSDEVKIENSAKVLFKAGDHITLEEGFNTDLGATFCAEIEKCESDTVRGVNGTGSEGQQRKKSPHKDERASSDLSSLNEDNTILIYPNPTNAQLNLKLNLKEGQSAQIKIIDANGKKVLEKLSSQAIFSINTEKLSEGLYFIQVLVNGELIETKKIVVKHH